MVYLVMTVLLLGSVSAHCSSIPNPDYELIEQFSQGQPGQSVYYTQDQEGGSKTWGAIKRFFSPVTTWFKSVPDKTPSELGTEIKTGVSDAATGIKNWADDSYLVQTVFGAIRPVKDWVVDKANTLKDKKFHDIYQDTKDTVRETDQKVGDWFDANINN